MTMVMNARKLKTFVEARASRQRQMEQAAKDIAHCYASPGAEPDHFLDQSFRGQAPGTVIQHLQDDIVESSTGYHYVYHCHSSRKHAGGEHGYFHLLAQADFTGHKIDIEREARFLAQFDAEPTDARTISLIGVSVNARGVPIELFTANRWITGDRFLDAESTLALLDRFRIDDGALSRVAKFLPALVRLFWPQAVHLLNKRDEKLFEYLKRRKRFHVSTEKGMSLLDDRRVGELVRTSIDLDSQIHLLSA